MPKYFRAAVAAAISFCAIAAPAQALAPLFDPAVTPTAPQIEPLLPSEAVELAPIATPTTDVVEADLAPVFKPTSATSLAQLVTRHAATTTDTPELECLAVAVYFESKGEPLAGQLAVANVIRNRSKSSRFARTYCGVIRQAGQFSFVRRGGFPPIARSSANWRTAVAIATVADQDLWDAPAANALFFHARRVSPGWKMARVASVGNHHFYR